MILCVDESGSMLDSVIYSGHVMAGTFARLPVMDVRLVILIPAWWI